MPLNHPVDESAYSADGRRADGRRADLMCQHMQNLTAAAPPPPRNGRWRWVEVFQVVSKVVEP